MSAKHKQQSILRVLIVLVVSFAASEVLAQDRPVGVWESDYGPLDFSPENSRYFATFEGGDYPRGRLIGQLSGRLFDGIWVEAADLYCDEARDGNKYWGRVRLEFNESFTAFEGLWSYCDADPSSQWDGYEAIAEGET